MFNSEHLEYENASHKGIILLKGITFPNDKFYNMTRGHSKKKGSQKSSPPPNSSSQKVSDNSDNMAGASNNSKKDEGSSDSHKELLELVKSSMDVMKCDILSSVKQEITTTLKPLSNDLSSATQS